MSKKTAELVPDPEGYESITNAIMKMVNTYPGLVKEIDEHFKFCETEPEDGLSIVATSGSFIMESHECITGPVCQRCLYPFMVIYRASGLNEKRKMITKEWIDTFARWMTRQPVTLKGKQYRLEEWPSLTDGRKIKDISRTSTTYLSTIDDGKAEVWVTNLQVQYLNEFNR